jgi:hypothetical protein
MILAKESAETDGVTLKEFCVLKAPDGTEWPSMYARLDGTKMDLETVREVITRASKLVSIVSKVPAGNIDSETELVDVFPFTETHVTDTTNVEWIAPPWQSVELGYISELATSYPLGDARGSSGPTGCVSLDYWFDGLQHLIKLGASGDTSRAALQERYDRWILQPGAPGRPDSGTDAPGDSAGSMEKACAQRASSHVHKNATIRTSYGP